MSPKHTAGPWRVVGASSVQAGEYRSHNHAVIADCSDFNLEAAEREANAKVIATAPDMLRELAALVEWLPDADAARVKELITRAGGEPAAPEPRCAGCGREVGTHGDFCNGCEEAVKALPPNDD